MSMSSEQHYKIEDLLILSEKLISCIDYLKPYKQKNNAVFTNNIPIKCDSYTYDLHYDFKWFIHITEYRIYKVK